MNRNLIFIIIGLVASSPANSEPINLNEFLFSIDRTEVQFSGLISYDSRDDNFTFYNEQREFFSVTVDAGREIRERIETECDVPMFGSYDDHCIISGTGTVEIRGSRIYISIEQVDQLSR